MSELLQVLPAYPPSENTSVKIRWSRLGQGRRAPGRLVVFKGRRFRVCAGIGVWVCRVVGPRLFKCLRTSTQSPENHHPKLLGQALRAITGLGLKDAKGLADNPGKFIEATGMLGPFGRMRTFRASGF